MDIKILFLEKSMAKKVWQKNTFLEKKYGKKYFRNI